MAGMFCHVSGEPRPQGRRVLASDPTPLWASVPPPLRAGFAYPFDVPTVRIVPVIISDRSRYSYDSSSLRRDSLFHEAIHTHMQAKLALADGTIFTGRGFGASGETLGEVVFNTSMMGYQEVLTDPSYTGQIVTMTYPLIGNYGTTPDDEESSGVRVAGFIVRELTRVPSNFRSNRDLDAYLKASNVIGIEGIDTRALVRRLRVRGAMNGILSTADLDDTSLVKKAREFPGMEGRDLVKEVVPQKAFTWNKGFGAFADHVMPPRPPEKRVVAIDYGMKWNILRCLTQVGCAVTVVPGTASADEVLAHNPDGVFLSNGPGDPAAVGYAIDTVKNLIGKKPIFGICLGHQLLGLALDR